METALQNVSRNAQRFLLEWYTDPARTDPNGLD
jgi:hypothetical protein